MDSVNSQEESILIPKLGTNDSEPTVTNETGAIEVPKIDPENEKKKIHKLFSFGNKNKGPKVEKTKEPKVKKRLPKYVKVILWLLLGIFVLLLIFGGYTAYLGYKTYQDALVMKASAERLVDAGKSQDLQRVKDELEVAKTDLDNLKSSSSKLNYLAKFPYIGVYVKDANHALVAADHGVTSANIVIKAIEPYADIIGLANGGEQAANGEETAQDRLDFVVNTIPDLIPQAEALGSEMRVIKAEIDQIDANRYPEEFQGIKIRSQLKTGIELVDIGTKLLTEGKPLLEVAPDLLGTNGPRTYLILFQNDKELRPTGGFLTAYSIATVENGKFKPVSSNDIYNLDKNYNPSIKAPQPLIDYLKGPYVLSPKYRLRDINWSPDFEQSMKLFVEESQKAGIGDIDGVIGVDTQLLVNLLDVIGPIGVPGFGNFSTENDPRCNCPNVIYELESFADVEGSIVWDQNDPTKIIFAPPNYENRKKIIGPLMNSVLSNSLGQSKEKIPGLFEAGFNSLMEKHVLFYLVDAKEEEAVKNFGIGGVVRDYDGDYLQINDANLGGRKSNLYVTTQVEQQIDVAKDGSVTKTLTITYNNNEKHDGWLNSTLPNWMRVYVPKGSELIDVQGLEVSEDPYEELDKTVFAGFFELQPQGLAQVVLTYKLPFKVNGEYKMLIQKQPGVGAPIHTIVLGNDEEEVMLTTDKELTFKL